jgi:hypothetical protein
MNRFIPISLALLLLAGCATIEDRQTQEMTIQTPGATGALCVLTRPGYRDRIWAPKTIRIQKSQDPLTISCRAPGNREKTMVIEPTISTNVANNYLNLFIGAAYDYESSAMYSLPKKIVMDFSAMKLKSMPQPDYQEVLDADPKRLRLEQFFPGVAAMNKDRSYRQPVLEPRKASEQIFDDGSALEDTGVDAAGEDAAPPDAPADGDKKADAGTAPVAAAATPSTKKGDIPDLIFPSSSDTPPLLNQ